MKITRVTEAERGQEGEDSEAASNYSTSESSNFGISRFVHVVPQKGSEKCVIKVGGIVFSVEELRSQQGSKTT